jgi:hypothetical protein
MRKRTQFTLLAFFVLLCALAVMVYLRQKAPPEAARLLPESDAIVFLNLKPLRAATHFDRNPVTPSPSYQQFIDATGIVFERDLDQAAFALHQMPDPNGPNGPVAFSEVFQGRFDSGRLTRYLASLATSQENYAGRTIYSIPSEGRTFRVALLGYDMIAASNMPTTEQIHSILDRTRAAASPFAGSSLLSARFNDIPLLSKDAWAIGHIGLPFAQNGKITVLGLELPMPEETTFVASLHYTNALHLRIEQITRSDFEAGQTTHSLNTLLNLFRSVQQAQQPVPRTPEDIAVREFIDSITIEQHKDRAVLNATLPADTVKRLTASSQP